MMTRDELEAGLRSEGATIRSIAADMAASCPDTFGFASPADLIAMGKPYTAGVVACAMKFGISFREIFGCYPNARAVEIALGEPYKWLEVLHVFGKVKDGDGLDEIPHDMIARMRRDSESE